MTVENVVRASTYAIVEDVAASWDQYERFAAALAGAVPEGLIVHAAGRTDEGFRIIEVWESEGAWRRFAGGLGASAGGHLAPGPRYFRELRPSHVVLGRDVKDQTRVGNH